MKEGNLVHSAMMNKAGHNDPPVTPRPAPPKGQREDTYRDVLIEKMERPSPWPPPPSSASTNFLGSCSNGHQFYYAGDPYDGVFPEGYPCACGKTVLHYIKCDACGQTRSEAIPKPKKQGEGDI
jgi:hypothetical protein